MLIPQLNSILATVDSIHRRTRYDGGRLDLRVLFDELPGFILVEHGKLPEEALSLMARQAGVVRIAFRSDTPLTRQRFAIARQVGHAVLHERHLPEYGLMPSERHTAEVRERQVKLFASELLVPLWAFERALPAQVRDGMPWTQPSHALLRGLAVHFGVSKPVVRIQLETYRQIRRTQAGRVPA